jgi:putative peptide zinc metalloprotease protein
MNDTTLLSLRPARSPHATIGPAMRVGTQRVHYVKNSASGSYYRLGVRETRLLSLMDGMRTLADIGAAYQREFGVALSEAGMRKILQILGSRGLLAGPDKAEPGPAVPLPRLSVKGWGEVYFRVADPGRLLDLIVRRLAWVDSRAAVWCIAALIGACELYALVLHATLWQTIQASLQQPSGALVAAFCVITYACAVLHELAHGTMCVRYGGRVDDMGLMFRYLMLFPYCKLDDLVVLPHARARSVVVLAGVTFNLLLLVPFAVLDLCLDGHGLAKQLCAYMLVFYNLSVLFNLLPYLRFDGYMLISIGRGRPELREESFKALRGVLGPARGTRPPGVARDWPLLAYGFSHALVTAAALGWVCLRWLRWSVDTGMPWLFALPFVLALLLYLKAGKSRAAAKVAPVSTQATTVQ